MKLKSFTIDLTKNKSITFSWWREIRKQNAIDYPDDPDINKHAIWGIHSNAVKKGNPKDSCLDWFLHLGHLEINYTDFNYNEKYRRNKNGIK